MSARRSEERWALPRPTLPPLLACGAALWAGTALGIEAGIALGMGPLGIAILVLAVVGAVCLVVVWRVKQERVLPCFVALFVALGLGLSWLFLTSLHTTQNALIDVGFARCRFQAVEDASTSLYGESATLRLLSCDDPSPSILERPVLVRAYFDGDAPAFGEEFEASASFRVPSEAAAAAYERHGIACIVQLGERAPLDPSGLGLVADLRSSFAQMIDEGLGDDAQARALAKALVLGDRTELFEMALYQEVKVAGLAHLVAVSGAHLVIVLGLVQTLLGILRVSRRWAVALQLCFLFLYVVMVGFPVSCLRAACMSVIALLSVTSRRRSHALSSLGVAVIVLVGLDPSTALSLSFALSVGATLGIVLFCPLLASWVPVASDRVRRVVVEPVAMTLAATLLTFPLSVACFAQFSLIAPLSNLLAAPLVAFVCSLGVLAFACSWVPPIAFFALAGVDACARCLCFVVDLLACVPLASVPVDAQVAPLAFASFAAAAALWIAWPRRFDARGALCCVAALCLCALLAFVPRTGDEIIMLDVGQGDAIVVRSRGQTVLVDTGNETAKLYAALARNGVYRLDAVVITHADDDHCGCLSDLRGIVACESVFVADGMSGIEAEKARDLLADARRLVGDEGVEELEAGSSFAVGAFYLHVLSPNGLNDEGGNADSLCLLVEYRPDGAECRWSALLCGDAEAEVLNGLVNQGSLGHVDVYKVGHHGARAALDEELAHALSPRIALVSVGQNNSYGHPNEQTIALLENEGALVFRSDEQGDAVCSFGPERIEVGTMR